MKIIECFIKEKLSEIKFKNDRICLYYFSLILFSFIFISLIIFSLFVFDQTTLYITLFLTYIATLPFSYFYLLFFFLLNQNTVFHPFSCALTVTTKANWKRWNEMAFFMVPVHKSQGIMIWCFLLLFGPTIKKIGTIFFRTRLSSSINSTM